MGGLKRLTVDELVRSGIPLARAITRGMVGRNVRVLKPKADLMYAEALWGLFEAARRYDPRAGASFRTFARRRIEGAIRDWMRTEDHMSVYGRNRANAAGEAGAVMVSLDDDDELRESIADPNTLDPLGAVIADEERAPMALAIRRLPRRVQRVLRLRFVDGRTFVEIGRIMGYSESRGCQVVREARDALRANLISAGA